MKFRSSHRKNLPAILTLRQIYILPTSYGLLFLVIVLAMLIGSINYNNNLGFLLTFLLGSMGFVSILKTYRMLHCLEVVSAHAEPVFAGQDAIVRIRVKPGKTDKKGLVFKLEKGKSRARDMEGGAEANVNIKIPTSSRGVFRPGRLMVESTYPTGLFRAWSTVETRMEYLVFPKPVPGRVSFGSNSAGTDNTGSTVDEGSEDFNGLVAYQPGDPPQRIFWKAYSKGQGLFTKSFSSGTGSAAILDMENIKGTDLETRLSKLCFQVIEASRSQAVFALKIPGLFLDPGNGALHRLRCLTALALVGKGSRHA